MCSWKFYLAVICSCCFVHRPLYMPLYMPWYLKFLSCLKLNNARQESISVSSINLTHSIPSILLHKQQFFVAVWNELCLLITSTIYIHTNWTTVNNLLTKPELTVLCQSTRPFARIAIGKGSAYTRLLLL